MTTIKVPVELRDRIKEMASQRDETMPSFVEYLLAQELRRQKLDKLRQDIAASSDEDLASWREEVALWDQAYDW